MKKIHKLLNKIICYPKYDDYRVIFSPHHIEVKLNHSDNRETVYLQENDKDGRNNIRFNLENVLVSLINKL